MSAFVCSDTHYQRIADTLRYLLDFKPEYGRTIRSATGDLNPAEFMNQVRLLNYNAIEQRYPDTKGDISKMPGHVPSLQDPAEIKDHRGSQMPHALTNKQLHGALRCTLYQLSEGDVPERPLYKRLEKLTDELGAAFFAETYADESVWEAE